MNHRCHCLLVFSALLSITTSALASNSDEHSDARPFGGQCVWNLPWEALAACQEKHPTSSSCLARVMEQHGASQQALALNQLLGGEGFMSEFKPMGRVNLATILFPTRANTNEVLMLVGGEPPLVSSEIRETIDISADLAYPALKRRFPDMELWTSGASLRSMERLPNGGQGFIFDYPLLNGCHACDLAGYALVSLDFGPDGAYIGPRLIRLEPAK